MMRKIITASLVAAILIVPSLAMAKKDEGEKVTICHRTNSVTNPYNKITVDEDAVDGQGNNDHSHHTGPVATSQAVAQALKDDKEDWGDIIPEILNWTTEGQAVYNNNCEYVTPSEPPVEPPKPPVTPPTTPVTTPTVTNLTTPPALIGK